MMTTIQYKDTPNDHVDNDTSNITGVDIIDDNQTSNDVVSDNNNY